MLRCFLVFTPQSLHLPLQNCQSCLAFCFLEDCIGVLCWVKSALDVGSIHVRGFCNVWWCHRNLLWKEAGRVKCSEKSWKHAAPVFHLVRLKMVPVRYYFLGRYLKRAGTNKRSAPSLLLGHACSSAAISTTTLWNTRCLRWQTIFHTCLVHHLTLKKLTLKGMIWLVPRKEKKTSFKVQNRF